MALRYEIDIHHEGGQIRAYGPNVYSATIKIVRNHPVTDEVFKRVFRRAVCDYVDESDDWYVFRLKEFRRISTDTAYMRAERPYDD